ncbi:MAG: cysteine hydrolase [Candidatus Eremiobacteraeota bacterium]|nr:cysteine hydrolase [Candidatus Eremiobacteraeota bacterium]
MERRNALIVVDVQRGFLNEHTQPTLERIERLQRSFATVIVTRFVNPEGSSYERRMGSQRHRPVSEDCELAFSPVPYAIKLDKGTYGLRSHLGRVLELTEDAEITLCGWDTDGCVLAIALELFDAGKCVKIASEACASSAGDAYHLVALDLLRRAVGVPFVETDRRERV